ncbi:2-oxo-4-hydroxy-4-carboxy-5-ureidoimidazoline decarboxylase [Streptomyces sp. XM4193]|uniref:2-oxo-4-hydroxy-4-carboxy-5-ureidoimidazoline decarboxylase n=1 Tax=Streptomyces sp. XM4193 TaxID=2929782 RepID=UPI001FF89562|nr:2-oxo-4-hydroxy-4-carboxy-5-ureidoimidazoline decarboxylase [Streptomyces sp. XM4193]MCK1795584.1 2-oxo-4-hydroxy-4-carboxy-5-ureidoimidazoline decarboxylase [Streptomyces sp. XM4193]
MLPSQRGTPPRPLDRLNRATEQAARTELLRCCGSRRWASRLAAHRPYPDTQSLLAAADEASYDLSAEDIGEALAGEAANGGPEHLLAPTDRPGVLAAHTALRAALAKYESEFGHAFVICLDELPPAERLDGMLAALGRRLYATQDEERAATADELRRLARGRLLRLVVRDVTVGSPSVPD